MFSVDAEWFGGQFDGATETITDDVRVWAVAWGHDWQRIPNWADLQRYVTEPNYDDPRIPIYDVHAVCLYKVVRRANTNRHFILYREVPVP